MFAEPSALVAYFVLLEVIITSLGGKLDKCFLTHSRLCGSELGSPGNGVLHILYSPLTCLITLSNDLALLVNGKLSQKLSVSLIFCRPPSMSLISL